MILYTNTGSIYIIYDRRPVTLYGEMSGSIRIQTDAGEAEQRNQVGIP